MAFTRAILALAVSLAAFAGPALAQEHSHASPTPPMYKWSFAGPFGQYDQGQLQRGFKVYREVCMQCHGMQLLSFRNLAEPGGPGFTTAQAAAVAAEYKYQEGVDDQGKPIERAGRLADHFPPPLVKFPGAHAAGHVGHRQGPRLRARLPPLGDRHVHARTRSTAPTTSPRC